MMDWLEAARKGPLLEVRHKVSDIVLKQEGIPTRP